MVEFDTVSEAAECEGFSTIGAVFAHFGLQP
jgi:hypothetical protein